MRLYKAFIIHYARGIQYAYTHTHHLKYKHEMAHTDTAAKYFTRNSINEKYENITKQMKLTLLLADLSLFVLPSFRFLLAI